VPAPTARRTLAARLALVVLFMIAAGLAVYQFVLRPKKAPPPPPPAIATLKFIVQPTDSIVEIGGKEVGRSSPFEAELDPGVYTVAVRRPGYKKWSTEVTLKDADKQTVRVALEPGVAQVSVTSQPPGLTVTLDGKQLDQVTPVEFQTQAGQHQLVVTNSAGNTWPQDFTAEIDGKYTFHAPLTAPTKKAAAAANAVRTPPPERVTERAPDRTPDRVTERLPDRATERAAKRGSVVVSRNGRDAVELPEPTPPPKQEEPPPPQKAPDAGVPAVIQEPPRANPVAPTGPRAPPFVAVNTVTKLSGDIPQIRANVTEPFTDVTGKLCIGTDGHVTSAKIVKALPEIVDELQRALMGWRYRPYVNSAGLASPACFALTLRVVFKRSN
jgi:hypothetical protein